MNILDFVAGALFGAFIIGLSSNMPALAIGGGLGVTLLYLPSVMKQIREIRADHAHVVETEQDTGSDDPEPEKIEP